MFVGLVGNIHPKLAFASEALELFIHSDDGTRHVVPAAVAYDYLPYLSDEEEPISLFGVLYSWWWWPFFEFVKPNTSIDVFKTLL